MHQLVFQHFTLRWEVLFLETAESECFVIFDLFNILIGIWILCWSGQGLREKRPTPTKQSTLKSYTTPERQNRQNANKCTFLQSVFVSVCVWVFVMKRTWKVKFCNDCKNVIIMMRLKRRNKGCTAHPGPASCGSAAHVPKGQRRLYCLSGTRQLEWLIWNWYDKILQRMTHMTDYSRNQELQFYQGLVWESLRTTMI